MQTSFIIIPQPHWPNIDDSSTEAEQTIAKLPEDEKIQVAMQRIIAGKDLYFTSGHAHSHSPFPLQIRERVITQLKQNGYQVEENEVRDDGSSIYGEHMSGWLDGVWVKIKQMNLPNHPNNTPN